MPKSDKSSMPPEKFTTVLMMIAPLAVLFILLEMRLGGLKHGTRQGNESGYFVPMPITDFDGEDGPFDLDPMDED